MSDYFNYLSICYFKISIHFLFNLALIKNFKITQVNVEGKTKSRGKAMPPGPQLATVLQYLEETFEEFS